MRSIVLGMVLALASTLAAADPRTDGPIDPEFDYHSYANTDQFRLQHLHLSLRVWLETRSPGIDGLAALDLKRLDPKATQLVLDTKGLTIRSVSQRAQDVLGATSKSQSTWVNRPFHLEKPDPILGAALVIELAPSSKPTELIRIEYETEDAAALQWLQPRQTAGRKKPFLYTQSEAIGARSWIPLQDTPQVRFTYDATVNTDLGLRAVMSAEFDVKSKKRGEYTFKMPQPVPSYLVALAVGDLDFKETGPRTGVWAEKSVLKAAAAEFAGTEEMIQANEKMFGPYRWSRYDILVMPPSFPVGGMENPRLSFITPTVIAGDKSLVSVIAHELAHSWAGNLVGNATWRDLWLNEGFTDYMESRIMTVVYGQERAQAEQVLGVASLRDDLKTLEPKDQLLAIDLRGRDPDLVFSDVPYEKGRLFLNFLDSRFGRERFDAFLHGYFDHFAFQSLSTERFEKYLKENLLDKYPGVVTASEVDQWIHGPGIPANAVLPKTSLFAEVDAARADWLAGKLAAKKFGTAWSTQQWQQFLGNMPTSLSGAQMAALDQAYGFTKTGNAIIAESWFELVIANDYKPSFPRLEEYLQTVGRIKLIEPLYKRLADSPSEKDVAKRAYTKARPTYHPAAVTVIDRIVQPEGDDDK